VPHSAKGTALDSTLSPAFRAIVGAMISERAHILVTQPWTSTDTFLWERVVL